MVVARGSGEGNREFLRGTAFPFYKMKRFCRSVPHQCGYTQRYWTIHLKMVKMEIFVL